MSTLREQLLAEIDAFLAEAGMRETALGKKALNNTAFVSRVRDGRQPRANTIDKLRAWMAANRRKRRQRPNRNPARVAVPA